MTIGTVIRLQGLGTFDGILGEFLQVVRLLWFDLFLDDPLGPTLLKEEIPIWERDTH